MSEKISNATINPRLVQSDFGSLSSWLVEAAKMGVALVAIPAGIGIVKLSGDLLNASVKMGFAAGGSTWAGVLNSMLGFGGVVAGFALVVLGGNYAFGGESSPERPTDNKQSSNIANRNSGPNR